ncbi:phospholipid-binding protein MlaC [Grimontia sp. NTOU-MAR1]|uniref:phospholipid-binding protein MlaC n=1 Tax=Grimontia sp. NTOU-MAR1 TaxID=3111011 RepID=UPI002DC00639|nr:phospholipid-binding protein MlaC [Grimontia sp. NTOU-MAR1]WRV97030.1 phospholipid-binding protein MlaC [Grimontia sp. NTOU-MAR1]
MKKWFVTVFAALTVTLSSFSFAAEIDAKDPYFLINRVAENAFSRLKADKDQFIQNPELLRVVVKEELMPYINVRYAAMKVLGPQARKASKEERDLFTEAFYDYLVASYAQILTQYTDQEISVEPAKKIDAKRKVVSVRVDILDKARPPIRLDFALRKNRKTEEWQGFDVQVEGVSMLDTKTSEWSSELRRNGIEEVSKQLIERSKTPITRGETTS